MIYQLIFLCFIIILLLHHNLSNKKKIQEIVKILDDNYSGNLDRRLIVDENSEIGSLVYKIIVMQTSLWYRLLRK